MSLLFGFRFHSGDECSGETGVNEVRNEGPDVGSSDENLVRSAQGRSLRHVTGRGGY